MNRISDKTKFKQNRGTGFGADYKPWILPNEFNSQGTASYYPDWKHGRMITLLSQAERAVYLHLRWDDRNLDIREQFPLNYDVTTYIAQELGFRTVRNSDMQTNIMTTDFLVSTAAGPYAVSVTHRRKDFEKTKRVKEKTMIEQKYWESIGIPFLRISREDINEMEVANISDVVPFYDSKFIYDDFSKARHLIATKRIIVDMTKPIDYEALITELKEDTIWQQKLY